MTTPTADWNDRRADARRNHERVLAAAIEVFTEQGLEATIPEIAARAGVGKATVYRSYPTKADLVQAIALRHIAWLDEQLVAAAADPDAFAGLESFIVTVMTRLAEDRLMVEILGTLKEDRDPLLEDDAASKRPAVEALRALMRRAAQEGRIRDDVSELDFQVVVGGAARALLALEIRDPQVWQRYARLSLNALRP